MSENDNLAVNTSAQEHSDTTPIIPMMDEAAPMQNNSNSSAILPPEFEGESDAVKIEFIRAYSQIQQQKSQERTESLRLQASCLSSQQEHEREMKKLEIEEGKNKIYRDVEFGKQQVEMDKTSAEREISRGQNSTELEKKKWDFKTSAFSVAFKPVLFIAVLFVIAVALVVSHINHNATKIEIPSSSGYYVGEEYTKVIQELKDAGFNNIKTLPMNDIGIVQEFLGSVDKVDSISINGDTKFKKGQTFSRNAKIVIRYHSKEVITTR